MNEQTPCPNCHGSGRIDIIQDTDQGPQPVAVPCAPCAGTGRE